MIQPETPAVTVTGAASGQVQNARMQAMLRIESEHAVAANAASDVNARMAKALAIAKTLPSVEAKTAGYSTWQTYEKGKPSKWRVTQSLALSGSDFAALAALVTRMQDEQGMLVGSVSFSLSPAAWQQRAATAASALGFASWRTGRVSVSSGDAPVQVRADMAMRMAAPAAGSPPPVMVEGGTTEITVHVSGDAILEAGKR